MVQKARFRVHRLGWILGWAMVALLAGTSGAVHAQNEAEANLGVVVSSPFVLWDFGYGEPFEPDEILVPAWALERVFTTSAKFTVGSTTSYGIEVKIEAIHDDPDPWEDVVMDTGNPQVEDGDPATGFDIAVYNGDATQMNPDLSPADAWSPFMTKVNNWWSTAAPGGILRPRSTIYGADPSAEWAEREHRVVIALVLAEQPSVTNPFSGEDGVDQLGPTAGWANTTPRFRELPDSSVPLVDREVRVTVTITEEPRP